VRVETAFDLPPDARIRADRDDLRRVLMNLVNNAVEAMNGKGTLRFRARIETGTTPTVRIDLEDTGCGIAPADMDRLFLPNFSTRTSGTGLGLFYSRKIVRDHGGDITATSVLGEGSVFTVTLPLDDGRSSGSDDAAPTETIDIAR
jgi:signal transduction histidine kinase